MTNDGMTDDEIRARVAAALAAAEFPGRGHARDLNIIQGLTVRNGHVGFVVEVAGSETDRGVAFKTACETLVRAMPGVRSVNAVLTAERGPGAAPAASTPPKRAALNAGLAREAAPRVQEGARDLPGVAAIIAVASGKGGVGKSTVAVNLSLALQALGLKVGLLDADIYGPSVPRLLGLKGKPTSKDGKKLEPMMAFGLKAISVGMLVDQDQPMIWRGPMVMTAITQLLTDVNWAPLDVLVLDMPPSTGDAQLTVAQRVALKGAVIVSTPQDIALIDARKGLAMFRRTAVPVFGIVENMSLYVCPSCGHEAHIFGHGGARATALELGCDFLGEIPLHLSIRETSDQGTPIVVSAPASREARAFMAIAAQVASKLSAEDTRPAPKILFLP